MLKHSPQVAILEVLIYFQFPSWGMMCQAISKRWLEEESEAKVRPSPVSVYTDLHCGSSNVLPMFVVQVMLYFLALTVYDQDKFHEFSNQQCFYICGAFVSAV